MYYNCNQGITVIDNTAELSLTNSSDIDGLDGVFNGFELTSTTSNFIEKSCVILLDTVKVDSFDYIFENNALEQTLIYTTPSTNEITIELDNLTHK